jgi:hypothetical protein
MPLSGESEGVDGSVKAHVHPIAGYRYREPVEPLV